MLIWWSFFWGTVFGVAARWGRFCLLRGIRQNMGMDAGTPRGQAPALQAFALAVAVALLLSQGLHWAKVIDLDQAQIMRPSFSWIGVFIGGAVFALGMVMANACGARSVVLLAGGNLRALITVVFLALGAQASSTGILVPLRQWLQGIATTTLTHSSVMQHLQSNSLQTLTGYTLCAIFPALLLLLYAGYRPALRSSPVQWICAIVIGALVAMGWWMAATVAVDPFEPSKLTSLSFISPLSETLLYTQVAVGREFAAASAMVLGVFAGALVTALATGTARWEGFDSPAHLAQNAVGGWLMGFGGVLAAGCSIGQGLSGLSTLAWATLPALAGIAAGTWCALAVRRRYGRQQATH